MKLNCFNMYIFAPVMWGSRRLLGDRLHGNQRPDGSNQGAVAPVAIKEQYAQHAKKARIRGFMGSYGVLLFSRPSAYIYLCISSHLG
jgi:hypothetical protein